MEVWGVCSTVLELKCVLSRDYFLQNKVKVWLKFMFIMYRVYHKSPPRSLSYQIGSSTARDPTSHIYQVYRFSFPFVESTPVLGAKTQNHFYSRSITTRIRSGLYLAHYNIYHTRHGTE
jgi:hypothetical protein